MLQQRGKEKIVEQNKNKKVPMFLEDCYAELGKAIVVQVIEDLFNTPPDIFKPAYKFLKNEHTTCEFLCSINGIEILKKNR